jgi:hypothetical protein
MDDNTNNLTPEQFDLNERIFNLVLNKVLQKVYKGLDEKGKKEMDGATASDDKNEKDKFIKKYVPDFQNIFKEELIKVSEEIMERIKEGY